MIKYRRKVLVLFEATMNDCLGVYSSMKALKIGVDYWMKERPESSSYFKEFALNYSPEAISWDYAYLSANDNKRVRRNGIAGGADVPNKTGVNLIIDMIYEEKKFAKEKAAIKRSKK